MSVTYEQYSESDRVCCAIVAWTSDSSGAAADVLNQIHGEVLGFQTIPSTASGEEPTDNWDLTLLDRDGVDLLDGLGANRNTATVERVDTSDRKNIPSDAGYAESAFPVPTTGALTHTVANAGAEKSGTTRIWYRR